MCLFCMNCGQCGKPIPPDVEAVRKRPLKCFECGETVEWDLPRCPNCGKSSVLPPGSSEKDSGKRPRTDADGWIREHPPC